jgi:hypothetical protein
MELWSTSCNVHMYCSHDTILHVFKGDLVDVFGRCKFYIRIALYKLKNNTNCTFNSISITTIYCFNSFKIIYKLFTHFSYCNYYSIISRFWTILNKHNQWSKFSYSFKKHYILKYIHYSSSIFYCSLYSKLNISNICSLKCRKRNWKHEKSMVHNPIEI